MRPYVAAFLFLLLLSADLHARQSSTPEQRLAGFEEEVTELLHRYQAPGAAVAIVEDGKVVYSRGFGYRDLEERLPVTTRTIFPIGSMTKAFTSALVRALEEDQLLSASGRPAHYVPDLVVSSEELNRHVRIVDLLTHQAGLGSMDGSTVFFPVQDRRELLDRLEYLEPVAAAHGGPQPHRSPGPAIPLCHRVGAAGEFHESGADAADSCHDA